MTLTRLVDAPGSVLTVPVTFLLIITTTVILLVPAMVQAYYFNVGLDYSQQCSVSDPRVLEHVRVEY
jgi:hypothetical protein